MGLPCGTCSRAREKPLPKHLQHCRAPQPLRSEEHLEGVPSLTGSDLLKVQMANSLYKAAVVILEFAGALVAALQSKIRCEVGCGCFWPIMFDSQEIRLSSNGMLAWSVSCLMHALTGVTETNAPSFWLRPLFSQILSNIVQEITNMLLGHLINIMADCAFQQLLRRNTRQFFVIAWQLVF